MRGAPEPERHLFIYRVDAATETEDLQSFFHDLGVTVKSLQCVSNENAKYKSFKLTVLISQFKQLFDSTIWPQGVCVRPYYTRIRHGHNDNGDTIQTGDQLV